LYQRLEKKGWVNFRTRKRASVGPDLVAGGCGFPAYAHPQGNGCWGQGKGLLAEKGTFFKQNSNGTVKRRKPIGKKGCEEKGLNNEGAEVGAEEVRRLNSWKASSQSGKKTKLRQEGR